MSRLLASAFLVVAISLPAVGAVPRELGPGLTLLRVQDLTEEIPEVAGNVILDLRYARGPEGDDASALRDRLRQRGPLRLVLYDATPAPGIDRVLEGRHANVVTVAPAGAKPAPDVAVDVDPATDRVAYDALEGGAELAALADASLNKRRFDEAALVRSRHRRGQPAPEPAAAPATAEPAAAPATSEPETAAAAPATPPPPVDVLLQHAIRLARGLQALGRG